MSTDFNDDLVRRMAALLEETGLGELEYETKDLKIRVARPPVHVSAMAPAIAAPAAASAPAVAAKEPAESGDPVPSPMVGTAYLAAEPGSAPFVQPGSKVTKGSTLLIVEAMKVMNPITAPRAGIVKSVLVDNGQPVEYGQTLVVLE
ncbi:MAG: acetyl-CoA carboxylase biotin carboxyl carrier protein subunit [Thalassobaculum sp.]|uniref:acetyl-CoA carboxylase biotin carboxyl carrier protein n=1 Tax=Thalassobaculum sp. TaxID=2022740 RepID=UPI0032EAE2AB